MSRLLLNKALLAAFPRFGLELLSARSRAHSQTVVEAWGCTALAKKLAEKLGSRVVAGPFVGLALGSMAFKEHASPYLLGTFESELRSSWEKVFAAEYDQILDVGAKFGYYVVALARRYPKARVYAFDTDPWARKAVRETAALNAVQNVSVEGFCSPEWLEKNLRPNAFVLSDCEGYEATLFGGFPSENLRSATLIIELHEEFSPGVEEALRRVFARTHEISEVLPEPTQKKAEFDFLSETERAMAVNEYRSGTQKWLFLRPSR